MSVSEIRENKKLGFAATIPVIGIRNDYSKKLIPL
jgi:hypothetical protein